MVVVVVVVEDMKLAIAFTIFGLAQADEWLIYEDKKCDHNNQKIGQGKWIGNRQVFPDEKKYQDMQKTAESMEVCQTICSIVPDCVAVVYDVGKPTKCVLARLCDVVPAAGSTLAFRKKYTDQIFAEPTPETSCEENGVSLTTATTPSTCITAAFKNKAKYVLWDKVVSNGYLLKYGDCKTFETCTFNQVNKDFDEVDLSKSIPNTKLLLQLVYPPTSPPISKPAGSTPKPNTNPTPGSKHDEPNTSPTPGSKPNSKAGTSPSAAAATTLGIMAIFLVA